MKRLRFCVLPARSTMHRHSHVHAYAAVVLSGRYEEAGDGGRHRVETGDVLIHPPFSAHCDRIPTGINRVLDIPLPEHASIAGSVGRVRDVDAIVKAALDHPRAAVEALLEQLVVRDAAILDWPELLARTLRSPIPPKIGVWAHAHGLARETVSRQFQSLYEVSPARYRVEARARHALSVLRSQPNRALADIAASCGFADQAHLSRDIALLTGASPSYWQARARRTSHLYKTAHDG